MKTSLLSRNVLLLSLFLTLNFMSCSDEVKNGKENEKEVTGLRIYLPTPGTGTRTTMPTTSEERQIKTLSLYLFDSDGNLVQQIKLEGEDAAEGFKLESNENYNVYSVPGIKAGNYYVMVTANMEDYCELPEPITKVSLENTVLNFTDNKTGKGKRLESGNLPMVCLHEEVKIGEGDSSDGMITIGENTTITTPLTFLCAKVRLTILFDASEEGFSQGFSQQPTINGNPYILNIVSTTPIKGEDEFNGEIIKEGNDPVTWEFRITKYTFPGEDYPNADSENPASDLSNKLEDESVNEFAWQGITYIPENLTENYSKLYVNLSINGEDSLKEIYISNPEEEGEHRIKRGNMYDITFKLSEPPVIKSDIYRIYWPRTCGPGIYVEGINGFNDDMTEGKDDEQKIQEHSKNRGEGNIFQDYYYYEFKSSDSPSTMFKLMFTNVPKIINSYYLENLTIEDCFTPIIMEGKKIYVAYINVDKYNDPKIMEKGFPYSIKDGDFIYVFWKKELKINNQILPYVYMWIDKQNEKEFYYPGFRGSDSNSNPPDGTYYGSYNTYNGTNIENLYYININLASDQLGNNSTKDMTYYIWDSNVTCKSYTSVNEWIITIDKLP